MEKILNDSEKIKRAEEIYARRRGIECENIETNNKFNIYKVLFKFLLIINIILAIIAVKNKNFIFSNEFINQFTQYSNNINKVINSFINDEKNKDDNQEESIGDTTEKEISKLDEFSSDIEQNVENKDENMTIAQTIKNTYSFIKPIEGTVTSYFGDRQSKYQNVSGYHKGIDIGAITGTKIKSAIDGTVIQVSSKGDYR